MTQPDKLTVSEPGRVMIFANPIAGRGLGVQIAHKLEAKLRATGYRVETFLQRSAELSDDQINQPAQAAVIIGGDGTLRAVAERLIQADVLPPLLTVPLGTANLMGQHLGIRWKNRSDVEDHIVAAIEKHQILPLDAGRANGRLLLLMAGVGYDAQVIHRLHHNRKGPIRFKDYLVPALLALREHTAVPLR
ncbi:MAG TPA: diacylglycerol kinase family protein, partial [Tepidisphaeraceae bacterium]|nr:diacylglycerol kinase family protein [Tepidisphaeraceae bacterium]